MSDTQKKKNKKPDNQQQLIDELKDKLARSLADYANLEKRIESQRQLFANLATASIVDKMLSVLDDLYLSLEHLQDAGLKMTIDKFVNVLKTEGLEEIKADGLEFDPQSMDCIDVAQGKQNRVVSVHKKGYKLNGQVIRPAQVVVGKDDKN